MIAERVQATLFGKIGEHLYSAFINSPKINNKNAYAISHNELPEVFDAVVIAVAEFDGLDGERAIVAPHGEIFYEPEIRNMLARLRNVKLINISCLYEKSCGAVIFYKTRQDTKILLVKNNNGRYWSFPKGHIEDGENEHQTAIREIKEETGLDVTIFNGFREKIQEEEIDSYIWVDLQQARKMCSYDNDLRIIDKAETAIHLMRT